MGVFQVEDQLGIIMSIKVISIINRYGGVASKIYAVGDFIYKQLFKNEKDANEAYRAVYPTLRTTFAKYGRDSAEFNKLLLLLAKSAPLGAKSSNFKRRYISNKEGWRQLPADPNLIPYGFWW